MKNQQLGFFNSFEDELRRALFLAKSLHIANDQFIKESYKIWNEKRGAWVRKSMPISVYNETGINEKVGSFNVHTDIDGNIIIENERAKYQYPLKFVGYFTDKLLKTLK